MTQATQLPTGENPVTNMTELVTEIARALVDDPDNVSVEAIAEGDSTVIRLRVAQSDVGKVIGKQGRTARSMRTILSAASMKLKHRFSLDIVEQGEPPAAPN
jgi:predicted RNA-binding protein YlqC (UPF0109 family)